MVMLHLIFIKTPIFLKESSEPKSLIDWSQPALFDVYPKEDLVSKMLILKSAIKGAPLRSCLKHQQRITNRMVGRLVNSHVHTVC